MYETFDIIRVVNNTKASVIMRVVSGENNGYFESNVDSFDLHDGEWHKLSPKTVYNTKWCTLPMQNVTANYKSYKAEGSAMELSSSNSTIQSTIEIFYCASKTTELSLIQVQIMKADNPDGPYVFLQREEVSSLRFSAKALMTIY